MKVFLTGASGFIGRALARRLIEEGHQVTGLCRSPELRPRCSGVRLVIGDVASEGGLDAAVDALRQSDAIAHLAAVRTVWGVPDDSLRRVNVGSGPRLLELAPNSKRFLFVSSVAVYGPSRGRPIDESFSFSPVGRYGDSKAEAERVLTEAGSRTGIPVTIARPGIVYGPGDTHGMVAKLARLLACRRFLLVGSGRARLSPLYVDDLARGLAAAIVCPEAAGKDFIFDGPEVVTVSRLVSVTAESVGRKAPPIRVPEWLARMSAGLLETAWRATGRSSEPFLTRAKIDQFTRDFLYDGARARTVLGFSPRVAFNEGMNLTVSGLRAAGQIH